MKTRTIILTITLPVLSLAGWTAVAAGRTDSERDHERDIQAEARMERAEARVRSELGIAPAMEAVLYNGVDPVADLIESGSIVEASIEEVRAAMDAAATTPGPEDDVAALRLRHSASCRFFSEDASAPGNSR